MKAFVVLAATASFIISGAVAAHAGKRLTTGVSGTSDDVECAAVNVSQTDSITLDIRIYAGSAGAVVNQMLGVTLDPGTRTLVSSGGGSDRWCEFVILSGSAKDLRASSIMYEGGNVVNTEPARDK
jgi:hypothetical protein